MRSDFWSLPYAAQQAIRRGETAASDARARGMTIAELEKRVAEAANEIERLREALAETHNDRAALIGTLEKIVALLDLGLSQDAIFPKSDYMDDARAMIGEALSLHKDDRDGD